MDAYEALLTRRSIRVYTPEPVAEDLIDDLLRAAMHAPSASNRQPWHFVVVTERAQLDRLAEVHEFGKMLFHAPLAIAVCGDPALAANLTYWIQDCSAATQNILLAAHARGLGAVWLGVHPREQRAAAIREVLGIPDSIVPLSLISIGYPAESRTISDRHQQTRVHRNRW